MIHSCTVRSPSGEYTEDEYGNLVPVTLDTVTICRFSRQKEMMNSNGSSLGYIQMSPKVAIPSDVSVNEEDKIISTVTGYSGTFNVLSVKAVYYPTTNEVSHYSCELAAVV